MHESTQTEMGNITTNSATTKIVRRKRNYNWPITASLNTKRAYIACTVLMVYAQFLCVLFVIFHYSSTLTLFVSLLLLLCFQSHISPNSILPPSIHSYHMGLAKAPHNQCVNENDFSLL